MTAPVPAYVFKGEYVANHDGDTVTIRLDHGRYPKSKVITEAELRVRNLRCEELTDPDPEKRAAAVRSAQFASALLSAAMSIVVQTYKGSFERTVADIWIDGRPFADRMVEAGFGEYGKGTGL